MRSSRPLLPAGSDQSRDPSLRSIAFSVYLPAFLFAVGEGAVMPFIVLGAREVGASSAAAGGIYALHGVAMVLFALPAGKLISRLAERRAVTLGTLAVVIAVLACAWSPSVLLFGAGVFVLGCGHAIWLLARLTYVSGAMPLHLRGRALSTLGGVQRIGHFVGPLSAAAVIGHGGIDGVFYIHAAASVVGLAALWKIKEPDGPVAAGRSSVRFRGLAREHAHAFRTSGVAVMIIGALRAARPVALPLWAVHVGLDPAAVGIIFGLSSAVDMVLFYPVGSVMDRFGRKYAAVPCAVLLSAAFLVMPLTGGFATLLAVGLLSGFGNGLGSGIVMTLGSDSSPVVGRAEFLGMWRVMSHAGQAAGPLMLAAVAGVASVGGALAAIGVFGLGGALFIAMFVREISRPATAAHDPSLTPPEQQ